MTHWKSYEAKALDEKVDADFAADKIKEDTHKAGKFLALAVNMIALNRRNADALASAVRSADDYRAKFEELYDRDAAAVSGG